MWRQRLKSVCPALRSYHLKTLFLHFLETTDSATLEVAEVETVFNSLLLFIRQCLEDGLISHYFIQDLNLLEMPTQQLAKRNEKELKMCVAVIKDFEQRDMEDVLSDNTKNTLILQEFKRVHPSLNILVIFILVLLNLVALSVGSLIYLAILSAFIAIFISFLYASVISVPLVLLAILAYTQFKKVCLCLQCSSREELRQGSQMELREL